LKVLTFPLLFVGLSFCTGTSFSQDQSDSQIIGNDKIVGGVETTIEEHPWQVAIIVWRNGARYLCGGTVISSNWILTAAHCFGKDPTIAKAQAIFGATKYMDAYSSGAAVDVSKIIIHPQYKHGQHDYDLALLNVPQIGNGVVIPMAASNTALSTQETLTVTGWGATKEGGATSDVLLMAQIPYVSNEVCNSPESYNGKVTSTMMCAGNAGGGEDSCQGDSGGPLVKGDTLAKSILVGVVSFGEGCARKLKYGVYIRVSSFRDWIASAMIQ
jgi:trypsin